MKKLLLLLTALLSTLYAEAQTNDSIAAMQKLNQLADESDYVFEAEQITGNLYTVKSDNKTYSFTHFLVKKVFKGGVNIGDTITNIGVASGTFAINYKGECELNVRNIHYPAATKDRISCSGVFILFCKKNSHPLDTKQICGYNTIGNHIKLNFTDISNCGFTRTMLKLGSSYVAPYNAPLNTLTKIQNWLNKKFKTKNSKKKEKAAPKSQNKLSSSVMSINPLLTA